MSGIFGVVDSRRRDGLSALAARMGAALRHRPWYAVETHVDPERGVVLGRVGIGGFNREPQPVRSPDGEVTVCFAGELVGAASRWAELERQGPVPADRTDARLVLELYRRRGAACIERLAGVFVAAIWDAPLLRLLVVNDRFGLYPTYYAHHRGRLLVAPEMKAILCDDEIGRDIDAVAVADYIRFQHVLGNKTFFAGVRLLENAACLAYDAATDCLTVARYWDPGMLPAAPRGLSIAEAAEEAGRLLDAAVRRCTAGPLRVGLQLSGGVDGRALLGFARRYVEPVTLTFGAPGCADAVYAARLARLAGSRHYYVPFRDGTWVREFADLHLELTEGEHSWIHAHGISTLACQRELFDVNLSGYGGGERSFTSPAALLEAVDEQSFCTQLFAVLTISATWPGLLEAEISLLADAPHAPPYDAAFESLRTELRRSAHLPPERRALAFSLANLDRRLYSQFLIFSRSHVEQRLPYCDYAYTEFVYALPREMLVDRRLRRVILRQRMPELTVVPDTATGLPPTDRNPPRLRAALLQRGRALFNRHVAPIFAEPPALNANYETWLRTDLRAWGEELLLGARARRRQSFNPAAVASLWSRLQSGREPNLIGKLAPLMTWELIQRRFCDSDGSPQT